MLFDLLVLQIPYKSVTLALDWLLNTGFTHAFAELLVSMSYELDDIIYMQSYFSTKLKINRSTIYWFLKTTSIFKRRSMSNLIWFANAFLHSKKSVMYGWNFHIRTLISWWYYKNYYWYWQYFLLYNICMCLLISSPCWIQYWNCPSVSVSFNWKTNILQLFISD